MNCYQILHFLSRAKCCREIEREKREQFGALKIYTCYANIHCVPSVHLRGKVVKYCLEFEQEGRLVVLGFETLYCPPQ